MLAGASGMAANDSYSRRISAPASSAASSAAVSSQPRSVVGFMGVYHSRLCEPSLPVRQGGRFQSRVGNDLQAAIEPVRMPEFLVVAGGFELAVLQQEHAIHGTERGEAIGEKD